MLVPESCSANDWGDRGEVGGMELLLPMLRLGDGSRFPSLGREPLVFIRGPWTQVDAYSGWSNPDFGESDGDQPEGWLKGRMVRVLRHQQSLSGESLVSTPLLVELTPMVQQVLMLALTRHTWLKVLSGG